VPSHTLRLPELSPVQERVVERLRQDGVAIVPFAELFSDEERWEQAAADMAEFVAETEALLPSMSHDDRVAAFGKAFLVRRYRVKKGEDRPTFGLDNPWVSIGASPELLGIVNAYRGEPMRLHDVDNWYTVPDAEAARSASQRWHRDGWENHIVKVFTYFNEVDDEAGPFEYVLGSAAGGALGLAATWLSGLGNDAGRSISVIESTEHQDVIFAPVPEPSSYMLMLAGLLATVEISRRKRKLA